MSTDNRTADAVAGTARGTRYVIGVDVGTGSARAGIFDPSGGMVASAKHEITVFHASGAMVEQSSTEIWNAVCRAVKEALAAVAAESVDLVLADLGMPVVDGETLLDRLPGGLPAIVVTGRDGPPTPRAAAMLRKDELTRERLEFTIRGVIGGAA